MKDPKQRKPLAERLKDSLEEAIRHHRGEITLKTTTLPWPGEPPEAVRQSVGIPPVSLADVAIEQVAPGRRKLVVRDPSTGRKNRGKPTTKTIRAKSETPR